jgi:hypothetical protein
VPNRTHDSPSRPPHGVDDVEALLPAHDELRDHRRVLKVGVDQHDGFASSGVEAGRGDLMAEVPRQAQQP